tara:strand:+ start:533 stop:886 length:354 start_codon:yes stop_codon:yes gene_type:complete
MKKLGEYIKQKRIIKQLTLRKFCEEVGLDPSNWSKIERGLLEGPKTENILKEIASVLELTADDYQEMKDIAAIESIPKAIRPSSEIMEALPVFFRTARELKPSEENLKKLIELLKKS